MSKNVAAISVSTFLIVFHTFSWFFLLPIHLKNLGADDFSIGLSYSSFGFGYTVAQIIGGYLSDRFGRKPLIAIPTWFFALFYVIMAISNSWTYVTISYLLVSIGSAFQSPSFTSMITESAEDEKAGKAFGFFELSIMLGIALGPLAGSVLVGVFGISKMIMVTASACFVAAFIRQFGLTESTKRIEKKVERFSHRKNFVWFTVVGMFAFLSLSLTINGPFLTLYQDEILGLEESQMNFIFGLASIPSAIFCLAAGWLSDHVGAKKITAGGILLQAMFALFWAVFRGELAFLMLAFIFVQFFYVSYQVVIAKITSERERARFTGFFGTITGLASSIGPYLGMGIRLKYGFIEVFSLCLFFSIFAVVFLKGVKFSEEVHQNQ